MTPRQSRSGDLGLIVWSRHQVEPDPGFAERYGARDDGAGPEASAALLALRNADVVVIGTSGGKLPGDGLLRRGRGADRSRRRPLGSLIVVLTGLLFATLHYWPPHG